MTASAKAQRGACLIEGSGAPCVPAGPVIGGCPVFPGDNPWNTDISNLPVSPRSAAYLQRIAQIGGSFVHPDFGSNPSYGIPYVVVPPTQPLVPITLHPVRRRERSRPVPHPPERPGRGRQ